MNRPRKNYPITQDGYPIESEELVTYLNEIDKYCDILEKALDKLSEHLAFMARDSQICMRCCPFTNDKQCNVKCDKAESWKEWAFKDE